MFKKGHIVSDETRQKMAEARRGKPRHIGAGRPENTPDVLWSKVNKGGSEECWPWNGFRNEHGYGRTWINNKGYYAHRVIYDLANPGEIELSGPKERYAAGFLMHSCDNPCCCNPSHLSVCTHAQNMADKVKKGRSPDFSGDKGPRCLLTMEQAREIRRLRKEENATTKELMAQYGISKPSVLSVLCGRTYKE